jgi:hypothetical protein
MMTENIVAAIITATATIFAAGLTFALTRWSDRRAFQLVGNRRDVLRGTWRGTFLQSNIVPDAEISGIELAFDPGRRRVRGVWTTRGTYRGKDLILRFHLNGGFHHDRFLKLDYQSESAGRIQFGAAMLELSADGEKLSGAFVGFGAISQMIVHGTLELHKD